MESVPISNEENTNQLKPYENSDDDNLDEGNSKYDSREEEIPIHVIEKISPKINYFLNIGNCFNIGIEENRDMLVINKNEEKTYTEKDFQDEYKEKTVSDVKDFQITNIPILFKYKNKGQRKCRYVIGIEYNKTKLLFVPVFIKDDVITSFACVSFEKYDTIYNHTFSPNPHGYPSMDRKNLHEIIYGKKAEKGGWYQLEKNTEESDVKAIWITMISGRSINQYDPDPDNKDFYYYHNSENGFNIKAPTPKNFIEGFDDVPKITEGNPGDFYKDENGDIYMKVDTYNIDHIDAEPFDARTHKLREIALSANMANRKKKQNVYVGVRKAASGMYSGTFAYRGKNLSKTFKTEIEAARFYDYYSLALHGVRTTINNVLPMEIQNDLLLYGVEKIPVEYRINENTKTLPVGITKTRNGNWQLLKSYKVLKVSKTYDSYDKVLAAWKDFEKEIEKFKEKEKDDTLERNKANYDDNYGYIVIQQDGKEYRIKLNIVAYKEFVHCHWVMKRGKPRGVYKGKKADLHIHVTGFYIKDYNRREMGTVDHRDQDPLDCTIEALRPASASLQSQNAKSENRWGYKGVLFDGTKFRARYKRKQTGLFDCIEDAAREYNIQVEKDLGKDENGRVRGFINIIPEGKRTTIQNLFSFENLTSEMLQDANIGELKAILITNPNLRKYLPKGASTINKENYKIVRDRITEEILRLE